MKLSAGTPCPLCSDARTHDSLLEMRGLARFSGDEAPLRLVLGAMPVLQCRAGHRYFVKREFPLWLMDTLTGPEAAKLPAGHAAGMLFRRYRCGDCGQPLGRKQGEALTFEVALAFGEAPPFTVALQMPVFACRGCGKAQLRSREELRALLPAALVHAFKEAGIKAPG